MSTSTLQPQIDALRARISALTPNASAEDLAMIAKAIESVAGQASALDLVDIAEQRKQQIIDTAVARQQQLTQTGDAQVQRVVAAGDTQEQRISSAYQLLDASAVSRWMLTSQTSLSIPTGVRERWEFWADNTQAINAEVSVQLFSPPGDWVGLRRYFVRNLGLRRLRLLRPNNSLLDVLPPYRAAVLWLEAGQWRLQLLRPDLSKPGEYHHQSTSTAATGSDYFWPHTARVLPTFWADSKNWYPNTSERIAAAIIAADGGQMTALAMPNLAKEGGSGGQTRPAILLLPADPQVNNNDYLDNASLLPWPGYSLSDNWNSIGNRAACSTRHAATLVATFYSSSNNNFRASIVAVRPNGATELAGWWGSRQVAAFALGEGEFALVLSVDNSNVYAHLVEHTSSASFLRQTYSCPINGLIVPLGGYRFGVFAGGALSIYDARTSGTPLATPATALGSVQRFGLPLADNVFVCNTGVYAYNPQTHAVTQVASAGWNNSNQLHFVPLAPGALYACADRRYADRIVTLGVNGVETFAPYAYGVTRSAFNAYAPVALRVGSHPELMQLYLHSYGSNTVYLSADSASLQWVGPNGRMEV
ncbi:MAG: hypothetical protein N2690_00500 [Rhodocyclaceae bacterium]|nr:hypothetical protein [Rhodocyclaceae bacterium]